MRRPEEVLMFAGGIVTVFVTNMDRSVRFYTEQLGLKLLQRYENQFAIIDGGHGLTIGLHPAGSSSPSSDRKTGISIGLYLTGKLQNVMDALKARGIRFDEPIVEEANVGTFAYFTDPDGNSLYVAEMKSELKNEAVGVR
jgi:catechol 2,3-dioxygenase-like lactoylglutathione lyase family enzyme